VSTNKEKLLVCADEEQKAGSSRRDFLRRASITGAVSVAGFSSLLSLASPSANAATGRSRDSHDEDNDGLKKRDTNILVAAEIAEALAVTTYTHISKRRRFSNVCRPTIRDIW